MLQFLQTGKVLYVLAAVCALGIVSKLVTSSLYKRLIKETGNMALTRNRNLKALKQKTENMFLLNHGIRNINAYIDRQVYGFQFMKVSLDSWDNLSVQAMILCFLAGGAAAFASYWYRCDSYYIVLYGTMGILSGLFLVFVDNGANIAAKRQQLEDCLVDYVENSPHFYKSVDKLTDNADAEKKNRAVPGILKPRLREIGGKGGKAAEETAIGEETGMAVKKEKPEKGAVKAEPVKAESIHGERQGGRFSVLSRKKGGNGEGPVPSAAGVRNEEIPNPACGEEDELTKSIEYLRESLDQIAAGREQMRRDTLTSARQPEKENLQRAKKELKPEDIRLLGEILQEYLT